MYYRFETMKNKLGNMNLKKSVFLVLLASAINLNAQVFTYTASSTNMIGPPGSTFYYHISFYNPTASFITVQFDRYTKFNPPYWYSCFCFIQCNPPSLDYVDIEIPPFSWGPQMSILFKTDSVNPGQATASIRFNQAGFQNNADTVHLTATTQIATGLMKYDQGIESRTFPNPTSDRTTIIRSVKEPYSFILLDRNGKQIRSETFVDVEKYELMLQSFPQGEYFLVIQYSSGKTESKKIIKN